MAAIVPSAGEQSERDDATAPAATCSKPQRASSMISLHERELLLRKYGARSDQHRFCDDEPAFLKQGDGVSQSGLGCSPGVHTARRNAGPAQTNSKIRRTPAADPTELGRAVSSTNPQHRGRGAGAALPSPGGRPPALSCVSQPRRGLFRALSSLSLTFFPSAISIRGGDFFRPELCLGLESAPVLQLGNCASTEAGSASLGTPKLRAIYRRSDTTVERL